MVDHGLLKGVILCSTKKTITAEGVAAINCWIQGILLFDFELVHVAGIEHVGPDALSRRPMAEEETLDEEDLNNIDGVLPRRPQAPG